MSDWKVEKILDEKGFCGAVLMDINKLWYYGDVADVMADVFY